MKDSFAISLLFGAAMYAALGLFGLAVFHDAGPVTRAVSDGYGIAYATIAAADNVHGAGQKIAKAPSRGAAPFRRPAARQTREPRAFFSRLLDLAHARA